MPEVLLNENKLPLGKTQRGVVVNDVGLPPWAKGNLDGVLVSVLLA
jgi:hypothetical protein